MTREEAYNRIDAIIAKYEIDDEYVTITNFSDYDALRIARKALEQEPCEDCISRQAVKEQMIKYGFHAPDMTVTEFVEDLPLVTPQLKTGYWIAVENEEMETVGYYCSECDLPMETEKRTDYCPNCGCRMVKPHESEDKKQRERYS